MVSLSAAFCVNLWSLKERVPVVFVQFFCQKSVLGDNMFANNLGIKGDLK